MEPIFAGLQSLKRFKILFLNIFDITLCHLFEPKCNDYWLWREMKTFIAANLVGAPTRVKYEALINEFFENLRNDQNMM